MRDDDGVSYAGCLWFCSGFGAMESIIMFDTLCAPQQSCVISS